MINIPFADRTTLSAIEKANAHLLTTSMSYYEKDVILLHAQKSEVKDIIADLMDDARKQGIVCVTNKNGKIGKFSNIGKIAFNVRRYNIEIDCATFDFYEIHEIRVDNFLLIIKTGNTSIAMQLT